MESESLLERTADKSSRWDNEHVYNGDCRPRSNVIGMQGRLTLKLSRTTCSYCLVFGGLDEVALRDITFNGDLGAVLHRQGRSTDVRYTIHIGDRVRLER